VQKTNENNHLVECSYCQKKMFPNAQEQVLLANQLTQFRSGRGIFGRPIAKAAAGTMPAY